jgi:hypothetical protein
MPATSTDSSLRYAVMNAARDAYRSMGGTDAEWAPRVIEGGADADDAEGVRRFVAG